MEQDGNRRERFKKNVETEDLFTLVNEQLEHLEQHLLTSETVPELPVIFIVGAQRSGTTLLMQLMIQSFKLSYPNNFIARFWKAPYIGASLFKSLPVEEKIELTSELGYTKGIIGPHEFGYFWKKWFPWSAFEKSCYEEINYTHLKRSLSAWQKVDDQPLIFKNLIFLTSHIKKLSEILPTAFFINIERKPIYTIQSTYLSRIKLFGSENEWFGIKPTQYPKLKEMPCDLQIAGQVFYVQKEVRGQLKDLNPSRYINISYESLVNQPNAFIDQLTHGALGEFLQKRNVDISSKLPNGNKIKIDKDLFDKFQVAYNSFLTKSE